MKPDILAKLAEDLRHDITSERQVVYLLVELRKLMQLSGDTGQRSRYYALEFYCDWAVHPILDRSGAQRIVGQFDAFEAHVEELKNASEGERVTAATSFLQEFIETLKLAKFREQLREYLEQHGLDSSIAREDGKWARFVRCYCGVIEGCPLKCSGKGLKFTDEVVIKAVDLGLPIDGCVLSVNWIWRSRITGEAHSTSQFF